MVRSATTAAASPVAPAGAPPVGEHQPDAARASRKRAILMVCCVAQFLVILDLSIVNVALPSIQVGLRFSSADLQWVVDAYAIVFAGFLMLFGRVADIFGQRRTFLVALIVFSAASLGGGLAPTSGILILARAAQGLGGAMMAACSLAIITSTFAAGPERHRAVALWGSMNGAGGAVGTLLSGVITQELSWRWVLLINAPVGICTALIAARVVAERRRTDRRSFDLAGALVLTAGLLLEAYGGVTAGSDGWGSASALVPIAIGSVLLTLFPRIEARAAEPLVPPRALTPQLKVVNGIVVLFSAALFPMWYVGSLYLQQVLSLSPISTGLCFLPMALMIMLCASRAGRLVGRFGVRAVLCGGLVLMTAGLALFARIGDSGSAIQYVVLPGVLTTMGIGFSIVPSTIAAVQSASPDQAGLASGLVNTSRQVGGGLGLAVLISIATLFTSHQIGHNQIAQQALTDGFRLAYIVGAGLTGVAAVLAFVLIPRASGAHQETSRGIVLALAVAVVVACFAAVGLGLSRSQGAPIGTYTTNGAYTFVSAPGLHPPKVQGAPLKVSEQLPGDILMANFYDLTKHPMVGQSGPLILGGDLQPLWFRPVPIDSVALNLNEQTYGGKPVLSWWQGSITATGQINSGEDVVVNQHYQTIGTLHGADGWVISPHEMLIRGDDVWVTANRNVPANLAKYGGVNGGAVIDSAVQEYDLQSGRLLYTWKASTHIPMSDSETQPPANGFPWDAYHVNSIDVLNNGTFLVSMRNTWAAYLVNVRTGKIEWTLGGKHSSFSIPAAAQFQWQHDVQMGSGETVDMFDDHCCDITGAGQYLSATGPSRGLVLKLDPANHSVKEVAQYSHGVTFESEYMGNVQRLPGGNVFVGWGEVPYASEFTSSGKLLFDLVMPTPDMSYRVYVKPWVGLPLYPPSGAARGQAGKMTVYASWNGATEVKSWRVVALTSGSTGTQGTGTGTAKLLARKPRSGFETSIQVPAGYDRFEVEAVDGAGRVIGTSKPFTAHG